MLLYTRCLFPLCIQRKMRVRRANQEILSTQSHSLLTLLHTCTPTRFCCLRKLKASLGDINKDLWMQLTVTLNFKYMYKEMNREPSPWYRVVSIYNKFLMVYEAIIHYDIIIYPLNVPVGYRNQLSLLKSQNTCTNTW